MKDICQDRFDQLTDVLEYTRLHAPNQFTVGERIMIHQERASCLQVLRLINEGETQPKKRYEVSPIIDRKINEILHWINIKELN